MVFDSVRLALDAAQTYERLGSPEGELALAEAVLYMAVAAKSNAVSPAPLVTFRTSLYVPGRS